MTTIRLCVTRGVPGAPVTIAEYEVPFDDGMTVLDALIWIREHVEPSLAVRYSCRANACKECSAAIDGKIEFLCTRRVAAGSTTRVEPLRKPRWIRDLVTELS